MDDLGWLGFWIFLGVFIACDSWVFIKGRDSLLQTHSTPEEKSIQRALIKKLEQANGKPKS